MKEFLKRNAIYILGGIIGAIGGYIYWATVGCETGTCPLKSSPWTNIIFGITIGILVFDFIGGLIKRKKQ